MAILQYLPLRDDVTFLRRTPLWKRISKNREVIVTQAAISVLFVCCWRCFLFGCFALCRVSLEWKVSFENKFLFLSLALAKFNWEYICVQWFYIFVFISAFFWLTPSWNISLLVFLALFSSKENLSSFLKEDWNINNKVLCTFTP